MMTAARKLNLVSIDDYLAGELVSRVKHEYLAGVTTSDGPTRVAEAVALAQQLVGGESNVQIILLTDGCAKGMDEIVKNEDKKYDNVQIVSVGQRTGNVAITAFQVRRSLLDPIGYEILVEVVNHSDDPVECRFEIDLNGSVIDVVPFEKVPLLKVSVTVVFAASKVPY